MPRLTRKLLVLTLALAIGLSGCALPASLATGAPAYQQTTTLVEIPALIAVGGIFVVIDLIILPFQAIFGSGNFFPLIGTLVQILTKLFGDDEPPPRPATKASKTPATAKAPAAPPPDATRPR